MKLNKKIIKVLSKKDLNNSLQYRNNKSKLVNLKLINYHKKIPYSNLMIMKVNYNKSLKMTLYLSKKRYQLSLIIYFS